MVLRPCARPPKQLMWFQEGIAHGLKTMYGGDVVMFVRNKIKSNNKYYMSGLGH